MKYGNRSVAALSLFFFLNFILSCTFVRADQLNFDRLYPESLLSKGRDHCVQLWAILDDLAAGGSSIPIELAIGHAESAKDYFRRLSRKKTTISQEDLFHLAQIIATIQDRSAQLPDLIAKEKRKMLSRRIAKLVLRIKQLLQANNAAFGTCH